MSQPPPPPPPPPPAEPSGQSGPQPAQPAPQAQPGTQAYGYPGYPGYPAGYAPRKPLDFAKLLTIGGWVVLGLYAVAFFFLLTVDGSVYYIIQSDDGKADFADRFFGGMPTLGQGVFYGGVLLGIGQWLEKQKQPT